MELFWFIPTFGDGRYLGTATGGRAVTYPYLGQIAQAVAWDAAHQLIQYVDEEAIASAQKVYARLDSEGQRRMTQLHGGNRQALEVSPNLWAGVGLVRGGAGTSFWVSPLRRSLSGS